MAPIAKLILVAVLAVAVCNIAACERPLSPHAQELMDEAANKLNAQSGPQTYAISCSTARPGWLRPTDGLSGLAVVNRIGIHRKGSLTWNGVKITGEQMREYVGQVPALNPQPFIILSPDPDAPCSAVESVRSFMQLALRCSTNGACGEGTREFDVISEIPEADSPERRELEQQADELANSARSQ